MEGSITQLNLSNYLINKKEKSVNYFQHQYQNHKNFVKDTRRLNLSGNTNFGKISTYKLSFNAKYGDYISDLVLEVELPDISNVTSSTNKKIGYCNNVGFALIEKAELYISGNKVDTQSSEWMDIWTSLTVPSGIEHIFNQSVKKFKAHNHTSFTGGTIFIPLQFWFTQRSFDSKNHAFCLPLAALSKTDIEIKFTFRKFSELITFQNNIPGNNGTISNNFDINNCNLLVDYIILEDEDRRQLQNVPRQFFLINQVQQLEENVKDGDTSLNISMRQFKYPVSELFWIFKSDNAVSNNQHFNYSNTIATSKSNPFKKIRISFEGKDKIPELAADFFYKIEKIKHHTNTGDNYIHCYSFAIEPENLIQPSGTCNFSNLSESMLHITFNSGITAGKVYLFALNYNVLQIDANCNTWLLHNLSKSSPDKLPESNMRSHTDPKENPNAASNSNTNNNNNNN